MSRQVFSEQDASGGDPSGSAHHWTIAARTSNDPGRKGQVDGGASVDLAHNTFFLQRRMIPGSSSA